MADAVIAMTHDASWKSSRLKGLFVRTFVVHLGLENVTVRTHILNLVDSWRRRAMVAMTRRTGHFRLALKEMRVGEQLLI